MKILTICPTYNRPKLCKQMLKSWHDTIGADNTMVLGLDVGDPSLLLYNDIKDNKVICKAHSTITEVINSIWAQYHDQYDFFHITNDDVIYRTIGWDTIMIKILKNGGIAYGNDLFQGSGLPTFPFISANIASALKWLQLPTLNRYCGDTVFHDIGKSCKCLYYLGEITIEHMHKLAGKGDTDVDMDIFREDWHAYVQWATQESMFDVHKVMGVLNG